MKTLRHKYLFGLAILALNVALPSFGWADAPQPGTSGARPKASEVCADDYWKWCTNQEAPFDCFKRRGLLTPESLLSQDCKRAWAKPKRDVAEPKAQPEPEAAPHQLEAKSKKAPASVEASAEEMPRKLPAKKTPPKSEPSPDDFNNLDFE